MPTLMLRGLAPALMSRIAAYAAKWSVGRAEAAVRLIEAGADHLDARSAGGSKSLGSLTDAERSARGKRTMRASVIAFAVVTAACGAPSVSPTGPSPPTPAPTSFTLSGELRPTAGHGGGATVEYAGHQVETDASGRFTFAHQAVDTQSVTVTHPNWLERQVWLSGGAREGLVIEPIALAAPFDLEFYRQFARDTYDGSMARLRRLESAPRFHIQTIDSTGATVDAETIRTVIAAIHEAVPQLTPFEALVETSEHAAPLDWIAIVFQPRRSTNLFACGQSTVGAPDGEITFWLGRAHCLDPWDRGRVGHRIALHEVGHAVGFWHTPPGYMMHSRLRSAAIAFTDKEKFHAGIAYSRPRGNMDPDHDPASFLSSTVEGGSAPVVSCP